MRKSLLLIPALALGAVSASGAIIYTQPFDNTVNHTRVDTLTNWGYASASGLAADTSGRQFGGMSNENGAGGTAGFAFNYIQNANTSLANVAWFAGDLETPSQSMSLAQSDLTSLGLRIGHGNTTNQTRWLMRINDNGTDRWFVSLQTYQMATAVNGAAGFASGNIGISANFADLTWAPLLNGSNQFDGNTGVASSGFTIITSTNPDAVTLPTGNITALGVYHWHAANSTATRFDDFTIVAVPEPSTYAALLGLLALGFVAYRRRR